MASKSAVLKLLEEKYLVKKGELEKLRSTQTRDLHKQRNERQAEILDFIKSHPITLAIPVSSSGKKKHAATFQVELVVRNFDWGFQHSMVYNADPTYSHLTKLIDDIEKVTYESLSQLAKEYKAIRESIILTGVPENIKDLLSNFEGL